MFLLLQNYTGQIKHALHSYLIKSHSYAYKNTYTWNKCVGKYIYDEWDRIDDVHIHQGEISFFVNVFWRQNIRKQLIYYPVSARSRVPVSILMNRCFPISLPTAWEHSRWAPKCNDAKCNRPWHVLSDALRVFSHFLLERNAGKVKISQNWQWFTVVLLH